jgi:hypothetical protein
VAPRFLRLRGTERALVIVADLQILTIRGHHLLDLNVEYGLRDLEAGRRNVRTCRDARGAPKGSMSADAARTRAPGS